MLKLAKKLHQLSFSRLMEVYLESNLQKAGFSRGEQLLCAEQEFYDYLSQIFFRTPGAVYAIWDVEGKYAAALRLEPYRDGLLLAALETAPDLRRKGHGKSLVEAVQQAFSGTRIYSHVAKDNAASLRLHEQLGFQVISQQSVYLDGSSDSRSVTLCWN